MPQLHQWSELSIMESLTTLTPQITPISMELTNLVQDSTSVNMIQQPHESSSVQNGTTFIKVASQPLKHLKPPHEFEMTLPQNLSELERQPFPKRQHRLPLSKYEVLAWQDVIQGLRKKKIDEIIKALNKPS